MLAATWLCRAAPVSATYSIIVADPETGQTGIAVASCVGAYDLAPLLRVIPGLGAVQVQAHTTFYGQTKLIDLLASGVAPEAALALVTDPRFDPKRALRQYAIVDFRGRSAAFTGEGDGVWAGDRQGSSGGLHYSAQGNLLTDAGVLVALESGFTRGDACDVAERLMFALEAVVSVPGRGDGRCTPRGVSADSGYLRVAGIDGVPLVELDVRDTGSAEPVVLLRQAYDAFRARHPCGSLPSEATTCTSRGAFAVNARPREPRGEGGIWALFAGLGAVCLALWVYSYRVCASGALRAIPANRRVGY